MDVAGDYRTIIDELDAYGGHLAGKPRVTALSKVDALDDETRAGRKAELERAAGGAVHMLSAVTGEGITQVLRALRACIDTDRTGHTDTEDAAQSWQP